MTRSTRDIAREIERRLNADPTIRDIMADLNRWTPEDRDPPHDSLRYWTCRRCGRLHAYTVERGRAGYVSADYRPTGPGSRTNRATEWRMAAKRYHRTRRAAKARAWSRRTAHLAEHGGA